MTKTIFFYFIIFYIYFFQPSMSFSNYEFDRKYSLESIGALKSWDNIDGVFAVYFEKAFQEYFKYQSRFRYVETQELTKILENSQLPYNELIENKQILDRVVRSGRIESLIRTKISKEGQNFKVQLDWLHSATLDLLAQTEFNYISRGVEYDQSGDSLKIRIFEGLNTLFNSIPFQGHITGIDQNEVTLNLGMHSKIKKGDVLEISTLEDVRRHPLLGKLEDWRFKPIGKIEIIEIQEKMSFGKILNQIGDEAFDRFQKVTSISKKTNTVVLNEKKIEYSAHHTSDSGTLEDQDSFEKNPIRLGSIGGGFSLGSITRKMSGPSYSNESSGFYFSPQIQGEIWITRDFFGSVSLSPHFYSHKQTNLLTGMEEPLAQGNGTGFQFDFSGGYYLHFTENFFGPKAYVKLGYRSHSYNLTESDVTTTSATQYKSLYIGLGGDAPIRNLFGAYAELNFGLIRSMKDTFLLNRSPSNISDIHVMGGGYYWLNPKVALRGGLQLYFKGADYTGGESIQHRVMSFTVKGLYYF